MDSLAGRPKGHIIQLPDGNEQKGCSAKTYEVITEIYG